MSRILNNNGISRPLTVPGMNALLSSRCYPSRRNLEVVVVIVSDVTRSTLTPHCVIDTNRRKGCLGFEEKSHTFQNRNFAHLHGGGGYCVIPYIWGFSCVTFSLEIKQIHRGAETIFLFVGHAFSLLLFPFPSLISPFPRLPIPVPYK